MSASNRLCPSQAPVSRVASESALDSDHYRQEYGQDFADRFDEYIDWDRRAAGEGDFFVRQLRQRGVRSVLDVACGTGFHSVKLAQAGFEVAGVDGSAAMLKQARRNARHHGVSFPTVHADWRELDTVGLEKFDAVICLGNSLTYLRPQDRPAVLRRFADRLKPGGFLLIDHRNYDAILRRGADRFTYKNKYYYCGAQSSSPEYADDDHTRFRIRFSDGAEFTTCMFPVRQVPLRIDLLRAGFRAGEVFGDFRQPAPRSADFYLHIMELRGGPFFSPLAPTKG